MKHLLLLLALLLAAPLAHAQDKAPKPSLKALDEKNGFRTHRFGEDVSQSPNLTLTEDDKNSKYYTSPDENLKIGEADVKEITYGFYKGKLATVFIKTSSLTDSRALLEALKAQYGQPFQSNQFMERYSWLGKEVYMNYDENSATGGAEVYISSMAISKQKEQDKKEAAKKAASDL